MKNSILTVEETFLWTENSSVFALDGGSVLCTHPTYLLLEVDWYAHYPTLPS